MFVIDWQLALWSLILFPVLIIWVRVLQIFQRRAFQKLCKLSIAILNSYPLPRKEEIARQFRELTNSSEGIADAYIESAFELSAAELDSLHEYWR